MRLHVPRDASPASPEATPRERPGTCRGRRVATPLATLRTPATTPQPSSYCTERVLRWRLHETQKQLALTTEELQRARFMVGHFQKYQDKRWQWQVEQVSEEVEKQQQVTEDLKADLQKVAVLALTHRDAELKSLVSELWSKWSLPGHMPRRPTKESTRTKDLTRLRARKRWNHVARFVAYAFGKGHSHGHAGSLGRFLAFRVKELCDLFQPSFEEKFGVYEALQNTVRSAEIEQSVKEKLKPKKGEKSTASSAFEELELEMMSSYTDAFEEAGGDYEVEAQLPEVTELMRLYRRPGRVRQDLGFEILGLQSLYSVNHFWFLKFEEEVNRLAQQTRAVPQLAPLKSYERARAKVLTRYGGDVSCLTDVMRASLVYPTIAEVYLALTGILREDRDQPRHDFRVMEVNDRFQFCHDGYRDITLLFDMSGVICEVQMQIKGIQEVKKSGGHKAYRVQREVNELIFEAAVQNSEEDLASLVKAYNVTGQGTKDKNGRSALHYTCQHGALKATRVLLAAGSSIWLEDDNGVLPFELALKQKRFETLFLCLTVMMRKGPRFKKCFHRIAEQIVPWWCANITRLPVGDADLLRWREAGRLLIEVLKCYEALPFLEPFLTKVAQQSTATAAAAVRALLTAGADQVLSAGSESLLDSALQKGHSEMVNMLVCMQRGDGTPYCAHCFKETLPGHLKAAAKLADSGYARAALLANADPRAQQAFAVGKRTALMAFAAAGDLELCRQLVAARSEVQWIDGSCCSAVHYALALKRHEVADFLRQQRAITEVPLKHNNVKDVAQYLLKAVQEGCCGAVHRGADSLRNMQFLKKEKDSVQFKEVLRERFGPSRWTLMHYAVKVLRSADPAGQVCRALLVAKGDPRLCCEDGETALHWAASLGQQQVWEALAQGAHRAEADDQALETMGRGHEVDRTLPVLADLLSETQKALRRQQLRAVAEMGPKKVDLDDDTSKWLQAGFFAFKHALLSSCFTFYDGIGEEGSPSPRRSPSAAKRKAEALKRTKTRTLTSQPTGRRNSLAIASGGGSPGSKSRSGASSSPRPSDAGLQRRASMTKRLTTRSMTKNLDVPDAMPRAGSSPSSPSSSPGSRRHSSGSGVSSSRPAGGASSTRPASAGGVGTAPAMARQVSGGSGEMQRQVSGGMARQVSGGSTGMSRQISGGSGSGMPRQTSGGSVSPLPGCLSRQVSGASDERSASSRPHRKATFAAEVEEL